MRRHFITILDTVLSVTNSSLLKVVKCTNNFVQLVEKNINTSISMRVEKVRAKSSPEMWRNPLSLASSRSYLPPIYPRRIPTLKAMEAEAEEPKKEEQNNPIVHYTPV